MYQERFYRRFVRTKYSCEISYQESDLLVSSDSYFDKDVLREKLIEFYTQIENYISYNFQFLSSLSPLAFDETAPKIVQKMLQESLKSNIGPFSGVAGAVAWALGNFFQIQYPQAKELIIENGGDIYLKTNRDKIKIGLYLTDKYPCSMLTVAVSSLAGGFGICSSSATIGHSLSLGNADLVTLVCDDVVYGDCMATAVANRIHSFKDAQNIIENLQKNKQIKGVFIAVDRKFIIWGNIEIV